MKNRQVFDCKPLSIILTLIILTVQCYKKSQIIAPIVVGNCLLYVNLTSTSDSRWQIWHCFQTTSGRDAAWCRPTTGCPGIVLSDWLVEMTGWDGEQLICVWFRTLRCQAAPGVTTVLSSMTSQGNNNIVSFL